MFNKITSFEEAGNSAIENLKSAIAKPSIGNDNSIIENALDEATKYINIMRNINNLKRVNNQ